MSTRETILYTLIGGFICGILLASLLPFSALFLSPFILLLGVVIMIISMLRGRSLYLMFIAFALFAVSIGLLRVAVTSEKVSDPFLESHLAQKIEIAGVVVREPDRRESTQRLVIDREGSLVLVVADPYPEVSYGDRIVAKGTLAHPENFETESGRTFDYIAYLEKDGIQYLLNRSSVLVEGHGEGNPLFAALYTIKKSFLTSIQNVIPEPESALMGGLLLGGKMSLGEKLKDAFQTAGVIHIVVLSGFNMTIIAGAATGVFRRFLSLRAAIIVASILIALFSLMVGLSATVVRAAVMAEIGLLAGLLARRYDILRALILAAFLMVLISPHILTADPSFQLSFLATFALVVFSPGVEKRLTFIPKSLGLREVVVATVTTQLFLLPFLLWMTGEFSLVALPTNLLVLPAIPLTMLLGFIAGLIGLVSGLLAFPFAFAAYTLLSYEIFMVEQFAALPFASFMLPPFPLIVVLVVYGVFGFLWFRKKPRVSQIAVPLSQS